MIPFGIPVQLLIAVAIAAFIWWQGYRSGAEKLERYKAEQFAAAVELAKKRDSVTEKVVTKYVQVAGKTQVVKEEVIREVVRYVETNGTSACLNPDWRRLHDLAARNELPKAGPKANGAM